MDRIKLIWDFRGPNAEHTAKHHIIHLEEFAVSEKIENYKCITQIVSSMHTMAVMIVPRKYMDALKVQLKPHRGQIHTK